MTTNWYNEPPYKLIGHTVVKALTNGTIIEDDIVHKFNKADGKSCGSINTAIAGPYAQTEKSVVQGYVEDKDATNRFLEDNDLRHKFGDVWYRPAKPGGYGYLISGQDFRTWHTSQLGWTYADIKPGQCLWIEAADQSDKPKPELTADEEKVVDGVAAITSDMVVEDAELEKLVTNEIKLRQRIKAAVLRARGAK